MYAILLLILWIVSLLWVGYSLLHKHQWIVNAFIALIWVSLGVLNLITSHYELATYYW